MKTANRIAVIGAGRMGSALVQAFLKAELPTTVWNRTRSKCEPLAALGASVADTVLDAVTSADIVVVNVNDYATSDRLLRSDDVVAALRGRIVVQSTSGSPRLAREGAEWGQRQGIGVLDAAIMATPNFIGTPGATILYAGSQTVFTAAEPALRVLGAAPVHVGEDAGHASALDSALLSFMWGGLFGVLVGAAICEAEGISLATYRTLAAATTPMMNAAADDVIARIHAKRFVADEATLAGIDAHYGAFRHLVELSEEHGVDPTVSAAFDRVFRKAIDAGHAAEDFAMLHTFMRPARAS
jgi:3-hydroxyisobutyrate dehydrogenase-like beta-hydroxyacid dehydrogenase